MFYRLIILDVEYYFQDVHVVPMTSLHVFTMVLMLTVFLKSGFVITIRIVLIILMSKIVVSV